METSNLFPTLDFNIYSEKTEEVLKKFEIICLKLNFEFYNLHIKV